MLLNVGLSETKATDEDYELINWLPPNDDGNDHLENLVVENNEDMNNNELLSVNFNDVSEIAINDILNEMRMDSPIENDLLNDLIPDEPTSNSQPDNGNLENFNINLQFDTNNTCNEQISENIITDNNWLDQLLNPEPCSIPDVQVDVNDCIQFRYEVSEQINWEPNISLSNVEDSNGETVTDQYNNGFNVGFKTDYLKSEMTPVLTGLKNNKSEILPCSTDLPMMEKELYEDITNYLKTEQIHYYGFISVFAEMYRNVVDSQDDDEVKFNHDNQNIPEYVGENDQLLHNPNDSFTVNQPSNTNDKLYKCNKCVYSADSLHGLSVHMRMHADERLNCDNFKFTTLKEYNLKRHEKLGHGKAYICEMCDFVTQSGSKMRSHMRKEH